MRFALMLLPTTMRNMPAPSELELTNPFTRQPIARIALADEVALDRAVERAHSAFESYRQEPAFRRAELLTKIANGIAGRRDDFAQTIVAEAGKPITLAEAEVNRAIWTFTDAANCAREFNGHALAADAFPSGAGHLAFARRFPIGVVYGITPFNFPLNLVAHKIAPALACGNTIVIKPSPKAPLSAIKLAALIDEADAPSGAVSVVPCDNTLAGRLIADPRVRHLSFTGSVPVGWSIHETAAKARKRTTLELGGNAGCIVHGDADLARAIPLIATGAFAYAGQSCISVQRVFVHESIADDFIARFLDHIRANIRCGDPSQRDVIVGPMIDDDARSRVLKSIEAARSAGANILCGGVANGPCIEPTVITNASPELAVCADEVFAPVVVIERYRDFDEALNRVNASRFGLQAGVFTRDLALSLRAYETLQVGGVMINQSPTFRLENMPYGGTKDSGIGREGARYAIEEMTELRTLVINTNS